MVGEFGEFGNEPAMIEARRVRGSAAVEFDSSAAILQESGRDAECCPPEPSFRRVNGISSSEGLDERLGHSVVGDRAVPAVGVDGSPQSRTERPVDALNSRMCCRVGETNLHATHHQGSRMLRNATPRFGDHATSGRWGAPEADDPSRFLVAIGRLSPP